MNQSICFSKNHVLLKLSLISSMFTSCYPQSSTNGQSPLTSILPLIILISIVLIAFWKRIFKKRERILPNQITCEVQEQEVIKNTVTLFCGNCSQKYVLGKDATVFTSAMQTGIFQSSTTFITRDSGFIDNSKDPDFVDSINVAWDELDDSYKIKQEVEIYKLKSLLSSGKLRWWRCQKCFKIQTYKTVK